jgi:hypothetical protein
MEIEPYRYECVFVTKLIYFIIHLNEHNLNPFKNKVISLQLALAGILPVISVALHSTGWVHIQWMVVPNMLLILLCCYYMVNIEELRSVITKGWASGILAVFLYDLSRIPFIYLGWDDFIPSLGGWIMGTEENFFVGYLWRYLGNGAGLGMLFSLLNYHFSYRNTVKAGCIYGVAICAGLEIVLLSSSQAQGLMFPITLLTCVGGLTGHLVYGLVLGLVYRSQSRIIKSNLITNRIVQ